MKSKLLLLFTLFAFALQAQVSQADRDALIAIYTATDGINWTNNTNWNTTADVSTWYGVTVEQVVGQDKITIIDLSNNRLNGTIPNSINDLVRLAELNISNNNLLTGVLNIEGDGNFLLNLNSSDTGINSLKLPRNMTLNIKNTPNLGCVEVPTPSVSYYGSLSMDNFDLGVKITDNCAGISNLDTTERLALKAIYNATNGDAWSSRTYASTELSDATDNKGFETIEFNGVRKITKLYLSGMSLNGSLPAEIDDFSELLALNLSQNSISNLPIEIGNISNLITLNVNSNPITTLPSVVGNLTELISFTFNNTQVDLLPTTIGNLTKLETLEFGSTRITLLPPEIGNLTELTKLVAAPNNIASIPTELGQLTKLVFLDFANCQISNTPAVFANLTELETLYLNNNQLQVVAGLGGFTKLKHLRLHNNRLGEDNPNFNTDLPEDLGDLVLLEELTLNNNKLTTLPNSIGNLLELTKLPLQHNSLTSLPSTIGNLVNLEELRLSEYYASGGNNLTTLPAEIGNLSSLKLLYVAGNKLASLPDEIGNLSNLEDLTIEGNTTYENGEYTYHLTTIPTTINNLTALKSFRANNNHIIGTIDLSNLVSLTNLDFYQNRITGLKLGRSPFNIGLTSNPNLSCIEVSTTELTNWETSSYNSASYIDNGVAFSDDCSGYTVPQAEREALIDFYLAVGGGLDTSDENTTWTGTFWDVDKTTSISNVGAWAGVTTALVNGQKHVVKIELNRNLKGAIPSSIKDLTQLQEMSLTYGSSSSARTELTSIAKEIGELDNLERLVLRNQKLSSLPGEIGNMDKLKYLDVSNNELTSLPAGIGNFMALEELHLQYQLQVDVNPRLQTLTNLPDEIGNITTLKKFYLQHNGLTSLPTTIGNLVNLGNFNIEHNTLKSLPTTINNLTMLDEFVANNNEIDGFLDISNLDVIDRLKLEYNHITGLKLNVSPTAFNIGSNNISSGGYYFSIKRNALGCIEVPSDELVSWQLSDANKENLNFIDNGVVFSDNCSAVTNNSIPDLEREALITLYNSTKGTDWKNDLSGSYNGVTWVADATQKRNVGAWFGVTTEMINGQKHVTKVELNSNKLDGTIPSVIKNLTQLKELEFNNNSVSEIASEIGELANLEQLTFTSQYDSSKSEYVLKNIPSEINNITSLKRLEMSSNQLEGNLDFSNLINLNALNLSSNQITGLKIGISPNVFDNSYNSEGQYSRSFSFSSNQYLNCIAVPQYTIADWEATTFAQQRPNIVWGLDCSTYNNVPEGEIQALVDMYNNLDGANWTSNTNWTGDLAKATINSPYNATKWQGVTTEIIDGAKHISRISLYNNKIKGEFSTSFGNLSKLKYLQMSSNELSGSIPASFGNLNSLEEIHLNNNQLTSLPSELSNLSNLKTVYFQDNELSGKVPDLSGITSLQTLYLSSNKFQFGDFEDEFTDYQNLTTFIYSPQAKVGVEEEKSFGTSGFTLEAEVNGLNNEYQWYKNGSKITDAINKTLEISEASAADNGYYFCYVTNTVVTSLTIQTENVTLTYDASLSIDNNEFSKAIKLFPNPVNDILQIRNSNNVAINKIEIFNTLGKRVQVLNEPKIFINVSSLPKGIYLMNIISEKGVTTKRIVKK
jgi:Leucine-rich repeat (LRR) protein